METLTRESLTTVQVNVGARCNQACLHCHVEAGPKRTEQMSATTAGSVLDLLAASRRVAVVDITGGAPELNSNFRRLVSGARSLGLEVIDRCNLTILFEPGMEDLAEFLAGHGVRVMASLPCYSEANVDAQRGMGVFQKSIAALQMLNELGYGHGGSGLVLDLVYNPGGASLPPAQAGLEADYRARLAEQHGVRFTNLLTLTNMPIKRFAHQLERDGKYNEYMSLLVSQFNSATVPGLMCRSQVSVAFDGTLYDCDFNQMLELGTRTGVPASIGELESFDSLVGTEIATATHCFGCTAGSGSSCGGALT